MKELIETVSTKSKVEAKVVRLVLQTAMDSLKESIEKDEKVKVQGFGTFVRRASKNKPDQSRVTFKLSGPKDPEKVKARKAAKLAKNKGPAS